MALRIKPDDPSYDEAQEIRKAAERGASLTRQLLAFSRSQMLETQLVDLNLIVPQLDGMMGRMAGDQVSLSIRVSGLPTFVRIEPGRLEQVLMNLIVNARDAMPNGGTIEVQVERIFIDERAVLRYPGISDGAFARIAVTDTGDGIDPDMQAHIFEPFFTTKNPEKGTGLGLSIVYGIAKEAGGTISFVTGPQKGTTFEVLLPLADTRAMGPKADR
jgi:signal transduction histidine kinase